MASRPLPVRFLEYLSSVTFVASVVFWLLVVYRFVSYDENHVGWNILLAIPVFVAEFRGQRRNSGDSLLNSQTEEPGKRHSGQSTFFACMK